MNWSVIEKAVQMRYGLLNYIRNVMIQDVANGIPMIRTILYENPNE